MIRMGIYRCNKCGNLGEYPLNSGTAEIPCPRCQTPTKIYETLFFIQKVLDSYFAMKREIQSLKTGETKKQSSQKNKPNNNDYNILNNVDIETTNILASQEQHEYIKNGLCIAI